MHGRGLHDQLLCWLQGRAQFQIYQRLLALAFAAVQGSGQLFFLRQYVPEYSPLWFVSNLATLMAGAMILIYVRPSTPRPSTRHLRRPLLLASVSALSPQHASCAAAIVDRGVIWAFLSSRILQARGLKSAMLAHRSEQTMVTMLR